MTGSRPSGRRCAGGYTLVELLVVLAILALAIGIAAPRFVRVMPGVALRATAHDIVATLRTARSLAIRRGREVAAEVDLAGRTVAIAGEGDLVAIDRSFGVSLYTATQELVTERSAGIRFYPDGTSTGGRLRLASEHRGYDIRVDWITGRVTIDDADPDP